MTLHPNQYTQQQLATSLQWNVGVKNIDGLTIVLDLNLTKEKIKSLKQKSSAIQQLSDQLTEIRCIVYELSAHTRRNAA